MTDAIRFLDTHGLTAGLVLLTHEHYDHIAGVAELKRRYASRLVCSEACACGISDPRRNFSRYLCGTDYRCPPADATFDELNWQAEFADVPIHITATPGHSPGSVCIAVQDWLFAGDTLIRDTRTVTKLPGGDRRALSRSLDVILGWVRPDAIVYPGHGESFRLSDWKSSA